MSIRRHSKRTVFTGGLIAVAALCGTETHAAERVSVATPLAIYAGAAGADYLSTRYSLGAGAVERNPLMQTSGSLAFWKLAQTGVLTGADVLLQKTGHKGKAKALRFIAGGVALVLVGNNAWVAHQQRRAR